MSSSKEGMQAYEDLNYAEEDIRTMESLLRVARLLQQTGHLRNNGSLNRNVGDMQALRLIAENINGEVGHTARLARREIQSRQDLASQSQKLDDLGAPIEAGSNPEDENDSNLAEIDAPVTASGTAIDVSNQETIETNAVSRPHAAVEKRYRAIVKGKISLLQAQIPTSGIFSQYDSPISQVERNEGQAQKKSVVLDRAVAYIKHLVSTYEGLEAKHKEHMEALEQWYNR